MLGIVNTWAEWEFLGVGGNGLRPAVTDADLRLVYSSVVRCTTMKAQEVNQHGLRKDTQFMSHDRVVCVAEVHGPVLMSLGMEVGCRRWGVHFGPVNLEGYREMTSRVRREGGGGL